LADVVVPSSDPRDHADNSATRYHADNSNTQFAILALWAARRHNLPVEPALTRAALRFRYNQLPDGGWTYQLNSGRSSYGAMTCVGLIALATGHATASPATPPGETKIKDHVLTQGLQCLAGFLDDPGDSRAIWGWARKGTLNAYYLWSVERVGALYGLRTIGGKDWYRWCVHQLLPTQREDGSWTSKAPGGPAVDTSLALLILKRADLMPGLAEKLQARVAITDPGPDPKGSSQQKGKDPVNPGKKAAPTPPEPLGVNLSGLKAGEVAQRRVTVRGPQPFRITAIRGTDNQLTALADSQTRARHELTLTLRPDKAVELKHTIRLRTDLPGQAEVVVEIRGRVAPAQAQPAFPLADK
jgi:hypothetical protein